MQSRARRGGSGMHASHLRDVRRAERQHAPARSQEFIQRPSPHRQSRSMRVPPEMNQVSEATLARDTAGEKADAQISIPSVRGVPVFHHSGILRAAVAYQCGVVRVLLHRGPVAAGARKKNTRTRPNAHSWAHTHATHWILERGNMADAGARQTIQVCFQTARRTRPQRPSWRPIDAFYSKRRTNTCSRASSRLRERCRHTSSSRTCWRSGTWPHAKPNHP
jgi:hypothetical protein